MLRAERSGWRVTALVAAVYLYFLIFAQFAFLKRLAELGLAGSHLNLVMAEMALGGILASLVVPIGFRREKSAFRIRLGLAGCSLFALLSLLPMGAASAAAIAAGIGASLGIATVTLVADLRNWSAAGNPLLLAALGTGAAYFACNVPTFFAALPEVQTIVAALACLVALLAAAPAPAPKQHSFPSTPAPNFALVLGAFTALVWLDSAAFFIIQQTPMLKAGTWQGAAHLWANACIHLGAALGSAALLARRGIAPTLVASVAALGAACILLAQPSHIGLASLFYPAGVSLYSVALVVYPAVFLGLADPAARARRAGLLYSIAGWIGSAMGIGMGQHLGHVPRGFVAVAALVVLLPVLPRLMRSGCREIIAVAAAGIAAALLYVGPLRPEPHAALTQIERGRKVYIAEGCIHCHSQYVRPHSADELLWGPAMPAALVHREQPPLIGNRRQGPDLSEIGGRRSALWLKMHFFHPAQVSGASIMPSFSYLFADNRGNDLVAYLVSLKSADYTEHQEQINDWQPSGRAIAAASPELGRQLYVRDCATCHDADGATRRTWASSFHRLPPNLATGPFHTLEPALPRAQLIAQFARIARFGIAGTDMPGHETLTSEQAASIGLWLAGQFPKPARSNPEPSPEGDHL